jgi:hypothetical protein
LILRQRIESVLKSSRDELSIKSVRHEDVKQLSTLQSKIVGALDAILILTISLARDRKKDQHQMVDKSRIESYCHTITFSLDYTRLDVLVSLLLLISLRFAIMIHSYSTNFSYLSLKNLGSYDVLDKDENDRWFTSHLSHELRRELNQNDHNSLSQN